MEPIYDIEEYVTSDGKSPFGEWLLGLKDKRAQAKIQGRIRRASFGNLGDWKQITGTKAVYGEERGGRKGKSTQIQF